ncbi:hypothetical protein BJX99DRAFT_154158 [Aspergillus californicus]
MLSQLARQKNVAPQLRLLKSRSLLQSSAKLRQHSQSTRLSSLQSPSSSASQETRPRRPSFQSSRSLATAADHATIEQQSYFENQPYASESRGHQQWSSLFPPLDAEFDPSSLVIVDHAMLTKPKTVRKIKGIGGDEDELMANFDLSLRVSQFERATALLNRLREYHAPDSPKYLALHNLYLQTIVSQVHITRQHDLGFQMQRWFEVDMPFAGVKPDATTFALMIRMALRLFHGYKRDRNVRRYWAFAKQAGVEEEVLGVPILSEIELGELSEICSSDLRRVAIDSIDPKTEHDTTPETDEIPDIRPVEQKGLGLRSLQGSISMFSKPPIPLKTDDAGVESKDLYNIRRQHDLEKDVMQIALDRWRKEIEDLEKLGPSVTLGNKRLATIMSQWHIDLTARLRAEVKLIHEEGRKQARTVEQKERSDYGIFLLALDPEKLAALTILTVMGYMIRGGFEKGCKLSSLILGIGNDLYGEVIAQKTIQKARSAGTRLQRSRILKELFIGHSKAEHHAQWPKLVEKFEQDEPDAVWGPAVKAKVGASLLSFLYEVAKTPVSVGKDGQADPKSRKVIMQPALQHSYQIALGKRCGYMHVHPELVKIVRQEPNSAFLGRHLPMVCQPKPWEGYKEGGYYLHHNKIIRTTSSDSLQPAYVKAALENNGLEQIRQSLDVLGQTAWKINRDVFNVMLEAWNTGDAVADLAPLEPNLPTPPKPSPDQGYDAQRKWNNLTRDIENQRSGLHSQRCFQNFQIEVARAYLNETFYLPHNMDFRGRAYPLPPYLNQMGADNSRGLLLFSEGKPLGQRGMSWLKVQIANLFGYDKGSFQEREQFTTDHIDDVLDSANNGLRGRRWWLAAEDPWQCLAACFELRNALQHPVPTEYLSRLPIHQDGSCNGLQHYAALGGDKAGAKQVNLEPSDRPSDVYTGVSDFVRESISRDAATGDPLAKVFEGKVTRKVVKQTVMTNVYGVTFMGALKQVRKQLSDHYPELSVDMNKNGGLYITRKVFEALGSLFNGAHDIQYWLGDCAARIATSVSPAQVEEITKEALSPKKPSVKRSGDPTRHFKSTLIWTTPLGLPVVQPYRKREARRITTAFQDINIIEPRSDQPISKRKQLQAFPPNFIHSLDATHMMLSANACHKSGLTFSAVHDSFWTHASDVDSMNDILREAFVKMHSDDIIKRLKAEFDVRYGRHLHYAKVPKASKAGQAIAEFKRENKSTTKLSDLLAEHKRQTLLNSDDPELQAEGRAMVTPASVFEQAGGTDIDVSTGNLVGANPVGHVPEDLDAAAQNYSGLETDGSDPAIQSLFGSDFNDPLDTAGVPEPAEAEPEDEEVTPTPKKSRGLYHFVWMPMRFKEVPKKGEWDLTRIRDSQYFFS